jgi:hypothetical protein
VEPALHPRAAARLGLGAQRRRRPARLRPAAFRLQTALQGLGQPAARAAAAARDRAAPLLGALGQRLGVEELLLDLYILERLCRVAEAEVSAVTGRPDRAAADLLELLRWRVSP